MMAVGLASLVIGDLAVVYAAADQLLDDERPAIPMPATPIPGTGVAPAAPTVGGAQ